MQSRRIITLTPEERTQLQDLLRGGTSSARLQTRARVLLLTDRSQGEARTDGEVAEALFTSRTTIKRLRRRLLEEGLQAALTERPRPGATPKLTGEGEAQLFVLACSQPPPGHARWSLRLLAARLVELQCVDSVALSTVHAHLKRGLSSPGP
jgi:putative transposase